MSTLAVTCDITLSSVVYRYSSLADERLPLHVPKIVGSSQFLRELPSAQFSTQGDLELNLSFSNLDFNNPRGPSLGVLSQSGDLTTASVLVQVIDLDNAGQVLRSFPGKISQVSDYDQERASLRVQGRVFKDINVDIPLIKIRDRYPSCDTSALNNADACERIAFGRARQMKLTLCQQVPIFCNFTFGHTIADNFMSIDLTSVEDVVVQAGSALYYDVQWSTGSATQITLDLAVSSGNRLGQNANTDQNALHPTTGNLFPQMSLGWYRRRIDLPAAWIGQTITQYLITCEANSAGTYQGFIANAFIGDANGNNVKDIATSVSPPLSVAVARNADGANNTGAVSLSATYDYGSLYAPGGAAMQFTGTGNVNAGNILGYDRTQAFSMEAWVKTGSGAAQTIMGKFDQANNIGYTLEITTTGKLQFILSHGPGNRLVMLGSTTMNDNVARHVATHYQGTSLATGTAIFVNGVLESMTATENSLTLPITNSVPFLIGQRAAGSQGFNGTIDEVRVWNGALPATVIGQDQHRNMVAVREDRFLAAYWNFDEQIWGTQPAKERISGAAHPVTNGTPVPGFLSADRILTVYRDSAVVDPAEWSFVRDFAGLIRFTRPQVDPQGREAEISVDVFSWAFDENFAYVASFLLSNTTYGASQPVNAVATNTAAAAFTAAGYRVGGGLTDTVKLPSLFPDLFLRGTTLELNSAMEYVLTVDAPSLYSSSGLRLAHGDDYINNAEIVSAPYIDDNRRIKSLQLHGGLSPHFGQGERYRLHTSVRTRALGTRVLNENRRFVDDAGTLDREACYLWERLQLEDTLLGVRLGANGKNLAIRQTALLTAPQLRITDATYVAGSETLSIDQDKGAQFVYTMYPDRPGRFTYTGLPLTIDDLGTDITDYSFTLPAAPTGLTLSQLVTYIDTNGQAVAKVALSATAPPANCDRLVFRVKQFLSDSVSITESIQITPGTSGIAVLSVIPGVTYVPYVFARNTANNAGFQDGFITEAAPFLVPLDVDVPTNNPSPTGISVTAQADGSMRVTLTWNYTQGAIPAEAMMIFTVTGTAPLNTPSIVDQAVVLDATSRAYVFQNLNPANNHRFGVAAARWPKGGGLSVGAVQSPLAGPDWADISTTGNYTSNLAGVPAADVVAGAAGNANGQIAFDGTVNYRTPGAPSNNVVPTTISLVANADASIDYVLGWNYTQGSRKADGFLIFQHVGDAAAVITDPHFELGAQNTGTFVAQFTIKGAPTDRIYSFGVATFRRTEAALEIGPIIGSLTGPDWQGITLGTPNFTGTIFNLEQHTFDVYASGADAVDTTSKIQKDGLDLNWPFADDEFNGGPRAAYGLSYNLTVIDLPTKTVEYQHCYNLYDYGGGAGSADLLGYNANGAPGSFNLVVGPGKFGNAVQITAGLVNLSDKVYFSTLGSSTLYAGMAWADLWYRHTGSIPNPGTILCINSNGNPDLGIAIPVLVQNATGTVSAFCYSPSTSGFIGVTHTTNVMDGNWHHLAASVTTTALSLWVDGVRTAVASAGQSTFTAGVIGSAGFISLGYSQIGQLFNVSAFDEVVVSTNGTLRATTNNFTPPDHETSEFASGAAPAANSLAIFHFQEPGLPSGTTWVNSRAAAKALSTIIISYNYLNQVSPTAKKILVLTGTHEPWQNRLNDGMAEAVASIGGSRAVFANGVFKQFSTYALVGRPNLGEGNGMEMYAGTVAHDPLAHVHMTFQTQSDRVVAIAGPGWNPAQVPGPPSNNPSTLTLSQVATTTGQRSDALGWAYTQPAASPTARPADGFILYYEAGFTSTPSQQNTKLGPNVFSFTFHWSGGQTVSYAIAAYRTTANGVEIGPKITGGVWQGVSSAALIVSPGIGTGQVNSGHIGAQQVQSANIANANILSAHIANAQITNAHISNLGADKITTGLLTVNPVSNGATAIFVDNSGKIRLRAVSGGTAKIAFENTASGEVAALGGNSFGEITFFPTTDAGNRLIIGALGNRWAGVSLAASQAVFLSSGTQTWIDGPLYIDGQLRGCAPSDQSPPAAFSSYLIAKWITLGDVNGNYMGVIPVVF